jgi:hypothetical protein
MKEQTWIVDLVGQESMAIPSVTSCEVDCPSSVNGIPTEQRVKFFSGDAIVAEYRLSQVHGWRLKQ